MSFFTVIKMLKKFSKNEWFLNVYSLNKYILTIFYNNSRFCKIINVKSLIWDKISNLRSPEVKKFVWGRARGHAESKFWKSIIFLWLSHNLSGKIYFHEKIGLIFSWCLGHKLIRLLTKMKMFLRISLKMLNFYDFVY